MRVVVHTWESSLVKYFSKPSLFLPLKNSSSSSLSRFLAPIRQTIKTIKEIVRDHSDADSYSMLKETNMDPNETTQKLLYQDPFHEVGRRRDKKKENTGFRRPAEPRKEPEHKVLATRPQPPTNRNSRRGGYNHNGQSGNAE